MKKLNSVKVGGVRYAVEYISDLHDDDGKLDGRIRHGRTVMQIESAMSDQGKAQAIWHEVVHALLVQSGRQDLNKDEGLVDSLAYGIFQVIGDNPLLSRKEK